MYNDITTFRRYSVKILFQKENEKKKKENYLIQI